MGFYFLVSSKYKPVVASNNMAQKIMAESSICRISPGTPCMLAWCCPAATQGHNLSSTGTMNYWAAMLITVFCPCCLTFWAVSCSDHDKKLGGARDNAFLGCFEACCCACCLNAKWMEAEDAATNQKIGCCNVADAREDYATMPGQSYMV